MYGNWKGKRRFDSFTIEYPSFSFLPFPIEDLVILDCYRGLFLCWCIGLHYIVCNSVTSKSVVLPHSNLCYGSARLGFDTTISSHFHVAELWVRSPRVLVVSIYSSKTKAWLCKESKWGEDILVCKFSWTMFLNGFMHMLEVSQIVAVDMEGKTWRKILRPPGPTMSIHGDQGQLCLCIANIFNRSNLST
jgi:hypothetical protein